MSRPYDRPATLAALVNGLIVLLLPVCVTGVVALLAPSYSNGGTRVVGVEGGLRLMAKGRTGTFLQVTNRDGRTQNIRP